VEARLPTPRRPAGARNQTPRTRNRQCVRGLGRDSPGRRGDRYRQSIGHFGPGFTQPETAALQTTRAIARASCKKGSRRSRKLARARRKRSTLSARRVRDLRHKGTRQVIDFCRDQGVGTLLIGDPRGVRAKDCGRHHNQRVSRWEVGKDLSYLGHKAPLAGITCFTGEERGTSSRCPSCRRHYKAKGRLWHCPACGFSGHRDLVGASNVHELAFGQQVTFPVSVTYRRPGPERAACGVNNRKAGAKQPPEPPSTLDTGLPIRAVVSVMPPAWGATGSPGAPKGAASVAAWKPRSHPL
jgi:IS605 OrfB family transposase